MKNRIELLAPAGDYEAFLAAVENGADAVYLGGKLLNARASAGNFDSENLNKAVDYAHVRGVKVYLALNTLVSDAEMNAALQLVQEAYEMGIDGVIVQDIGLAGIIKRTFPDLPLHGSTQMTIYNIEGVRLLEKLGFKRAVLARELSLEEITYISNNSSLEIEVFIHGALCISYSGQCLMSSIIGGRSGNRGKCAQPCRLQYELVNSKENSLVNDVSKRYLLSPKDICSIDILDKLIKSGVKSFKIEGRMKSPEYVATIVKIYRKYLDSLLYSENLGNNYFVEDSDKMELLQIFNRGGFSSGYLVKKTGKDMMCFEKPKNWGIYLGDVISYNKAFGMVKTKLKEPLHIGDGIEVWNGEPESPGTVISEIKLSGKNTDIAYPGDVAEFGRVKGFISLGNKIYKTSDKKLILKARETYSGKPNRMVHINGRLTCKEGEALKFCVWDDTFKEICITSTNMPQKAINCATSKEKLIGQIKKTGGTPFQFYEVEVELQDGLAVPVSEINVLRRNALEELEKIRAKAYKREISIMIPDLGENIQIDRTCKKTCKKDVKVAVCFNKLVEKVDFRNLKADRIYLPFSEFLTGLKAEKVNLIKLSGTEIYVWLPAITRGNYDKLIKTRLKELIDSGIDGVMAGNLGILEYVREHFDINLVGDYSLNIFNNLTIEEIYKLKLSGFTASPELNLNQISQLTGYQNFMKEVIVYGRLPLMTSEYCCVGSIAGGFSKSSACNRACEESVYRLRDRKGIEFPVACDKIDCRSTIFNSNVLLAVDSLDKIVESGVDMIRLNITDESPEEILKIAEIHNDALKLGKEATNKHNREIEVIKSKGFTRGHFFKGV